MTKPRIQYGALPFRIVAGTLEILLVTSRETRRWIVPKGWPMLGKAPHRAAAREAFEEAGVKGEVGPVAVGSYLYDKRLRDGAIVLCRVEVFPLWVKAQRRRWPEYEQRETAWFTPDDAAGAVQEPGLADLIRGFAASLAAAA